MCAYRCLRGVCVLTRVCRLWICVGSEGVSTLVLIGVCLFTVGLRDVCLWVGLMSVCLC